jgi:uncharacterized pyridoxal phosphate-containing UPF0001 family protein
LYVNYFKYSLPFDRCNDQAHLRYRGTCRDSAAAIPNVQMDELSMGMTDNFKIALKEGATIIRVGPAIFGARHYQT